MVACVTARPFFQITAVCSQTCGVRQSIKFESELLIRKAQANGHTLQKKLVRLVSLSSQHCCITHRKFLVLNQMIITSLTAPI